MRIALHDAEEEHLAGKTFPNLALMKISAYHKQRGDSVEWWIQLDQKYDAVYSSKVFDFTPENPYLPASTIKGGTGYDVKSKLPPEIEAMEPDYSIYPHCDYAIGFLTRGCIRNCPWCVVPEKEGNLRPYRAWEQIVRPDTDKLVLMDNNILACEHGIRELQRLIGTGYRIDINQGMDARLVTPEIVDVFKRLDWIRFIRFSCDTVQQIPSIERVHRLFVDQGVAVSRLFIYVLVRRDLQEASERVEALKKLRSINLYAQAEQNPRKGIVPTAMQEEFALRYVYKGLYRRETWQEYCVRKHLCAAQAAEGKAL